MNSTGPDRSWLATTPLYPMALAAALVLGSYAGFPVPLDQLWRPLAVAAIGTGVLLILGGTLTRKWHAVAFVLALTALAIVGIWPVLLLVIGARIFMIWRGVRARVPDGGTAGLTYPFNVLSIAWLGVSAAGAIAVATALPPAAAVPVPIAEAPAVEDLPNIYVILLDGYPRADSLLEYFGYDNSPFLDALESRGFHVSVGSVSDETTTFLTLPSMFQMETAEDLGLLPYSDSPEERRQVFAFINASPAVATLRDAGYEIHSVVPGAAPVELRDADVVWESAWPLSALETTIVDGGAFNLIGTEWWYAQRREVVNGAFGALTRLAERAAERRFVFAHIMSPHAPFAFEADGSPRGALPCHPWCEFGTAELPKLGMTLEEIAEPYIGQLEYVNARVLDAVDAIAAADPDAVVVLLSDHGARFLPDDSDEWHRTLFVAETPGKAGPFGDRASPTNLFPTLFNEYFGTDLPLLAPWAADAEEGRD